TLDMILNEKSKEFYAEGLRYWDMLRLGKEITFNDEILGFVTSHRTQTIDTKTFYKVILPIPENELNANPKIQQNPGYSAPLR
ncbi:MAG: RagB/SusD family nutrient uptake outer membrane protein, partial [Bacteroidales bacterium]|nr:RagB/SusD family nutrient uptake outer membrane protein [Bacteroidales bacterium]